MEIRLGESIRKLRKEAGFTQEQLAEALGVSVSAVHKWESGKARPTAEKQARLSEVLDIPPEAGAAAAAMANPYKIFFITCNI